MWSPFQSQKEPEKYYFTESEQKQILVIVTGCLLAALAIVALWALVRLLNWLGGKLQLLIAWTLSILWSCILLLFDLTLHVGRLATGLLVLVIAATLIWAYTHAPSFTPLYTFVLGQIPGWAQLLLPTLLPLR